MLQPLEWYDSQCGRCTLQLLSDRIQQWNLDDYDIDQSIYIDGYRHILVRPWTQVDMYITHDINIRLYSKLQLIVEVKREYVHYTNKYTICVLHVWYTYNTCMVCLRVLHM